MKTISFPKRVKESWRSCPELNYKVKSSGYSWIHLKSVQHQNKGLNWEDVEPWKFRKWTSCLIHSTISIIRLPGLYVPTEVVHTLLTKASASCFLLEDNSDDNSLQEDTSPTQDLPPCPLLPNRPITRSKVTTGWGHAEPTKGGKRQWLTRVTGPREHCPQSQ